jgi:hypothetical protein
MIHQEEDEHTLELFDCWHPEYKYTGFFEKLERP